MQEFVEIESKGGLLLPKERKDQGGSFFDDELVSRKEHSQAFIDEMNRLMRHLNQRPDHAVMVGTSKDREQLRAVFNHWKAKGLLGHNPNIRIDYGVPEGTLRVGDGR